MRTILKLSLTALLASAVFGVEARADVTAAGNFSPSQLGDAGGPLGADLIIGDTGVAGFFMDAAPPLFDPLLPLEAPNVIVGNASTSIGAMTLEDFLGGDIIATTSFIAGNAGQGFVDLFDSASITVGSLLTVGAEQEGLGVITVNGQGSRIIAADVIVGDLGVGQLELNNRAAMLSENAYIGNGDGSAGTVLVTGVGTRWAVGSEVPNVEARLTIGNLIAQGEVGLVNNANQFGQGQGTLNIADRGLVQVADEVIIGPNGHLKLETQGRLRVLPTSEQISGMNTTIVSVIRNEGIVSGSGYIDFVGVIDGPNNSQSSRPLVFTNAANGEIRNTSNAYGLGGTGTIATNQREKLVFNGNAANLDQLINDGTIESLGGEMEFNVPVVNNLEIIARDAVMRFNDGLLNSATGTVIVGGDSTLHGVITPAPLSNFVILNDSIVTISGDLIFTEPFLLTDGEEDAVAASGGNEATLSIGIGDNPGFLTVTGNLDLTNAVLDLDFAGSTAPVIGDIVNLIQVGGDVMGTFQNSTVNVGGQVWDIDYSGGDIFATFTGVEGLPGDFDGDGDVDGRDFLTWQRNPSIGSLSDWQANYGQSGSLGAVTASVPEPGTMVLLLTAALAVVTLRK